MAVKSYQAQGEGEISLSKGEKIKGDRVGPGGGRARGGKLKDLLWCPMHSGDFKEP